MCRGVTATDSISTFYLDFIAMNQKNPLFKHASKKATAHLFLLACNDCITIPFCRFVGVVAALETLIRSRVISQPQFKPETKLAFWTLLPLLALIVFRSVAKAYILLKFTMLKELWGHLQHQQLWNQTLLKAKRIKQLSISELDHFCLAAARFLAYTNRSACLICTVLELLANGSSHTLGMKFCVNFGCRSWVDNHLLVCIKRS